MIATLLAELLTVTTHNGTVNYLFRKPHNGPRFIRKQETPKQQLFSVYLLSKNLVQNVDIEVTLLNNATTTTSLIYDSTAGVSFEFVRLQIVCDKCGRLTFAPALSAPMVGMFWCVVNISKMQHMYVPDMAALKQCHFYVDQFLVEKGRFHTFIDNQVSSANIVRTPDYATIGSHMDSHYAQVELEQCLSCTNSKFNPQSQCTCGDDGQMLAGECYTQLKTTQLLSSAANTSIKYFFTCEQAQRSIISIDYIYNDESAIEYRTFLSADCPMTSTVIRGSFTIFQTGTFENQMFGISDTLKHPQMRINISLELKQRNAGLGSSALAFGVIADYITLVEIRIQGELSCEQQTAGKGFALVALTYLEMGSIDQLGIFGAVLNVTGDNVGLIFATTKSGWCSLHAIYIAPDYPEQYQAIPYATASQLELTRRDFPCFGYSSNDHLNSLKYATYFDVIQQIETPLRNTTIIIRDGGNNVGVIFGKADSEQGYDLQYVSLMANISNVDGQTSKSGVGMIAGYSASAASIIDVYVEGEISSNSNCVGFIGEMAIPVADNYIEAFATKLDLKGASYVGVFGKFIGGGGPFDLKAIIDVRVNSSAKSGFFGYLSNIFMTFHGVGILSHASNIQSTIGECAANVSINNLQVPPALGVVDVLGSYINVCSGSGTDMPVINATELRQFTSESASVLYAVECASSVVVDVAIAAQVSGRKTVQIMRDDACGSTNLAIRGSLVITTEELGTTELRIAGYVAQLNHALIYFNTSLEIKHVGLNGTKRVSMLALEPGDHLHLQFLRISGTILADSKGDIVSGAFAAFLFCTVPEMLTMEISNAGLFGAQINFTGADAAGAFAVLPPQTSLQISDFLVQNLTSQQYLMSQLTLDRYYYFSEPCAIKLNSYLSVGLNYEQFQNFFGEGRETAIFISYRKAHNVGIIAGWLQSREWFSGNLMLRRSSIHARIEVSTATDVVGLFVGNISGYVETQGAFASGNLVVRRIAGLIGYISRYSYLMFACKLNITGGSQLGTIGQAYQFDTTVYFFFDNFIKYSEVKVGGLVGELLSSVYFTAQQLVCRCAFEGTGIHRDELVGFMDKDSIKNFYDGALVNEC